MGTKVLARLFVKVSRVSTRRQRSDPIQQYYLSKPLKVRGATQVTGPRSLWTNFPVEHWAVGKMVERRKRVKTPFLWRPCVHITWCKYNSHPRPVALLIAWIRRFTIIISAWFFRTSNKLTWHKCSGVAWVRHGARNILAHPVNKNYRVWSEK